MACRQIGTGVTMITGLSEQLRIWSDDDLPPVYKQAFKDAADEIERLRSLLSEIDDQVESLSETVAKIHR